MLNNNEKIRGWFRLLWPIIVALLLVAAAFATLRADVKDNTEDIEKVEIKAEATENTVIKMEANIAHIKEGIDEIKQGIKDERERKRTP